MSHLLIFAGAHLGRRVTQTTILPTARTSLSMAAYKALPKAFAKVHPRYLTPSVVDAGVRRASRSLLYCVLNYTDNAINVIADAVSALGMMIAFYYGLTGFACVWYYRTNLTSSPRNFVFQGLLPFLGGLMLLGALVWSLKDDWLAPSDVSTSYTGWHMPFRRTGRSAASFLLGIGTFLVGIVLMFVWQTRSRRRSSAARR